MAGNAGAWLMAARPKTLPAGVAPVVLGSVLAWDAGAFHAGGALACLVGALLIQIGTNFSNDYFDFVNGVDTAQRIGPTRATQAGLISPRAMLGASIAVFLAVLVPGIYIVARGGWPFVVVGVLSLLFGVLYTGGPFPLGYLGLGDILVLIFFGPVAVAGTFYVQALHLPGDVAIAGLAPGLFSMAILTVNNLRDLDQDRVSGKRTLAVRFGRRFARWEYALSLVVAAGVIPLWLVWQTPGHPYAPLALVTLPAAAPWVYTVFASADGRDLNDALAGTGKLLLLFTVSFSVGWVL